VTNSIPDSATVCWDLRASRNDAMDELKAKVIRAIEYSAAAYGATAEITLLKEIPAADIHDDATALISAAIVDVLGEAGLTAPKSTAGGEDFFFYPSGGSAPISSRGCTTRTCILNYRRWKPACRYSNAAWKRCWDNIEASPAIRRGHLLS